MQKEIKFTLPIDHAYICTTFKGINCYAKIGKQNQTSKYLNTTAVPSFTKYKLIRSYQNKILIGKNFKTHPAREYSSYIPYHTRKEHVRHSSATVP